MRIVYIGNFSKIYDEEYIARSFEQLGHEVFRMSETARYTQIIDEVIAYKPDFVLFAKFRVGNPDIVLNAFKRAKIKTVCWVFDLYWGYTRNYHVYKNPMFKADVVFTTDGGHQKHWEEIGINHKLLRQGIYKEDCFVSLQQKEYEVLFVGSENPDNKERNEILNQVKKDFSLTWLGKRNTNECRGAELNVAIAKAKIVIGDSVVSPFYWSNRVVETLGRGGFLIHVEVEGIKEEYPDLVTYERGNYDDLKQKIEYYLSHDKEREEIVQKNYKCVLEKYTCEHKVQELCQNL